MLRASLAVLVLMVPLALLSHAAEDATASAVAKVPLPAGAACLEDRAALKAVDGLVKAWAKERSLEPGTTPGEVYTWSGPAYKVGRSAVTRAALERALTADGYVVENFDRERVNLNPFDLLHRGHLYSLEQAARRVDRLVVGINTDASTRRLKGDGRPVQDLATRAAVLAALRFVDLVASASQHHREGRPHVALVVDDENAYGPRARVARRWRGLRFAGHGT